MVTADITAAIRPGPGSGPPGHGPPPASAGLPRHLSGRGAWPPTGPGVIVVLNNHYSRSGHPASSGWPDQVTVCPCTNACRRRRSFPQRAVANLVATGHDLVSFGIFDVLRC